MHTIMLLITCIVFISAGVFHAIESTNRLPTDPPLTFGEALYFLLVTMATVGYGDIAPLTSGGKAVAAAVIVISFTVIPRELARLNQLVALQSQFRRFFQPTVGNPHILVVGHVADPRALLDFFRELYHPDRILLDRDDASGGSSQVTDPPCVLMGPDEPSEAIINLLDHPILQNRVTFIKGSVMSEEDLCRVGADSARACFVLVPKFTDNPQRVDADTVLRLLSIRNYNTDLEVYTQIVSPTYSNYINDVDADHVLCLDQVKLGLLAKSCICPGLVTLVSNMFRSSALTATRGVFTGWEKEYVEGLALEVYATKLPTDFFGLTFTDACAVLYQCTHGEVILLGVYEPHDAAVSPRAQTGGSTAPPPPMATGLPHLKVQAMPPRRSLGHGARASDSSRMYINPGSTLLMTAGQIVYVLSESKKLTQTTAISQHLKTWLIAGNTMPLPLATPPPPRSASVTPLHAPRNNSNNNVDTESETETDTRGVHVAIGANASDDTAREVVVESAVHPVTRRAIENHIIVVTDLDAVTMQSFMRLLRLPHHTPGSSEYHTVLFLSWTKSPALAIARRALQGYDDAFIMLAAGDSRAEFLRANILRAARCVLLSDKSSVSQLDGETIDSHTIFHYLAILSIQSEFGMDTTSGLMPIVELSIPGTMKILDTALKKRTVRSFLHRQKMEAYLRATRPGDGDAQTGDSDSDSLGGKRHRLRRGWTKKIARQIAQQDSTMKLRKRMLARHSTIRREHDTASHKAGFDSNVSALLPFFAAGYAFADDIFDNMLCQSFYTPGLIRFTYALLFTENGRPPRRFGSSSTPSPSVLRPNAASTASNDPLAHWIPDAASDDEDRYDDDSCDDGETDPRARDRGIVASSIVQFPVPSSMAGRSFGELFSHLLKTEDVVAIGLFRGCGVAFSLPYVAAGPAMDTTLAKDDLVFALAQPASADRLKPSRKAPPRLHREHHRSSTATIQQHATSPRSVVALHPKRTHQTAEQAEAADLQRTIERLVLQTR
ncbi:hypothetical protein PINS_up014020 [Pythium insidiosum]|nr:hypothetical protein PINS_up014020 [Pythium insidiosum]